MLEIDFKIIGVERLLVKLADDALLNDPVQQGIKKVTLLLQRLVMFSTPVLTDRLRTSWHPQVEPLMGRVGTIVEYAPRVEYGDKRMEARHVERGSSVRILGKGPLTYALELLQVALPEELKNIGVQIKAVWDAD